MINEDQWKQEPERYKEFMELADAAIKGASVDQGASPSDWELEAQVELPNGATPTCRVILKRYHPYISVDLSNMGYDMISRSDLDSMVEDRRDIENVQLTKIRFLETKANEQQIELSNLKQKLAHFENLLADKYQSVNLFELEGGEQSD